MRRPELAPDLLRLLDVPNSNVRDAIGNDNFLVHLRLAEKWSVA
jgi:hypothetical protein